MHYENDRAYLATCYRFGIVPSLEDYAEFIAEAEADAPDDCYDEED